MRGIPSPLHMRYCSSGSVAWTLRAKRRHVRYMDTPARKDTPAQALSLKARALIMLERYEEALTTYDDMLEIDTIDAGEHPLMQTGLEMEHAFAWTGKGTALSKLGRYDE